MGKTSKSAIKRAGPTTHLSVKPGKADTQRAKALSHKVVIPTAKADDRGAVSNIVYNNYLTVRDVQDN